MLPCQPRTSDWLMACCKPPATCTCGSSVLADRPCPGHHVPQPLTHPHALAFCNDGILVCFARLLHLLLELIELSLPRVHSCVWVAALCCCCFLITAISPVCPWAPCCCCCCCTAAATACCCPATCRGSVVRLLRLLLLLQAAARCCLWLLLLPECLQACQALLLGVYCCAQRVLPQCCCLSFLLPQPRQDLQPTGQLQGSRNRGGSTRCSCVDFATSTPCCMAARACLSKVHVGGILTIRLMQRPWRGTSKPLAAACCSPGRSLPR